MGLQRLLDCINEVFLLEMSWAAWGTGVRIVNLLQDLGCQDQQHYLQRPYGMSVLILSLSKVIKKIKKCVAALGQLLIRIFLQVSKFVRISVHPVPNSLLQALHQDKVGILLQGPELGYGLSKQLGQSSNIHINMLYKFNVSVVRS